MHEHLVRKLSEQWEAVVMTGDDASTSITAGSEAEALAFVQSQPHVPMTDEQYAELVAMQTSGKEVDDANAVHDLLNGHMVALRALAATVTLSACQELLGRAMEECWHQIYAAQAIVGHETSSGDDLRAEFKDAGFTTDFDDEPWSPEAAAWVEQWVKTNM